MHSKWFKKVKTWYDKGLWTKDMVFSAVPKMITAAEYEEIVGEPYTLPVEEA
ncbi:MAG: XkdX family protein [Erysipelotrichaceae bacterium]|nr:XkdX family protein [Erysipelotrichaceae bacterium]